MGCGSKLLLVAVATTMFSSCGDNGHGTNGDECGSNAFFDGDRCNALTECSTTEYEAMAPTTTTDRVCASRPRLTRLEISRGALAPGFDPEVFAYQVHAPITIVDVTFIAEASPTNATITVEGLPVMAGVASMEIPLDLGENDVEVQVTTADGLASETYVVNVSRAAELTYVKASNTHAVTSDTFGYSIALSGDGLTLAVGATGEDSAATGIGGDQGDGAGSAGAVYVFRWGGTSWSQEAYVKASNTDANDNFGESVALSADGSTLAVGAAREDSSATGIDGDQADNSSNDAGAVYLFHRSGANWNQEAYVKASNTGAEDNFGQSLSLSGDGSTLAVGAHEDSAATGIGGNQADNSATNAGAVYVFRRTATTWIQDAYVKASNTDSFDLFGWSVALSADGATLAVGAPHEDSAATGIDGNHLDGGAPDAGAVYVYRRSGTIWSQEAYVKASNADAVDLFGVRIALSGDGSTLAVGSTAEASAATGIGGDQTDNSASGAGAVYVFLRSGTSWSQEAYVKASNTDGGDLFGICIALSGDGSTMAVGATYERSATTGVGGDQADNSALGAGAVYVFHRTGAVWSQAAYVKAPNTDAGDHFGRSIALSSDAWRLAVGAPDEDGVATGIGGNQADNSAGSAGAVYLFD